jgi:ribosomal-protein-alanine N-acetyltransferase
MLHHIGTQTIETNRVILRKYNMSDAEDMFRNWVTDPEVSRFFGWEPDKNIEETKSLLSGWIEEYTKPETYHWVIVLKNASQAIGCIYLNEINNEDNSVSVHYLLSRKYWNQGLMTEACKCVLDFAFSVLGVKKVHTLHHVDNPASGKVQQKCGMRYVKTAYRQVPDCEQISGDYSYYELTIDDWKHNG